MEPVIDESYNIDDCIENGDQIECKYDYLRGALTTTLIVAVASGDKKKID